MTTDTKTDTIHEIMKTNVHPSDYRDMVVLDTASGFKFLTKSTAKTDKTVKWEDGKEYPLQEVYISSASHPFYTGKETMIDTEGRVDRFKARTEAAKARQAALASKAKKAGDRAAKKAAKAEAEVEVESK